MDDAFDCPDLASVTLEEGVKYLGMNAMKSGQRFDSIHIPASVETLSFRSFGFYGSDNIQYAGTKEQWKALNPVLFGIGTYQVQCSDGKLEVDCDINNNLTYKDI